MADPWKGPASPSWHAGLGFDEDTAYLGPFYRVLEAAGSGAAKGAAVVSGVFSGVDRAAATTLEALDLPGAATVRKEAAGWESEAQGARERVRMLTPDPATTGTAVQLLHGLAEGAYLMAAGGAAGGVPGAALAVGSTEGISRTQELQEQGLDSGTSIASGLLAGVTAGAGAVLPAAYGSTLATRLLSGAAGQTAFGLVGRGGDHLLLEAGGYHEMAQQQKVLDGTQMLIDAALGVAFGGLHHLQGPEAHAAALLKDPAMRDAALTVNLALKDREAAPGVPVDPESANVHQAALEKATADVLEGKPVDVSQTGIDRGRFVPRPEPNLRPAVNLVMEHFKETGLLDEEANLRELEGQLQQRLRPGEGPPPALTSTPAQVSHEIDDEGAHVVTSENGATLARQRGDRLQVLDTQTTGEAQGKGEGTARIERLAQEAHGRGLVLASDTKVSPAAARVYDRLERKGYEVTRHPAEADEEGHLVSTSGRPVFEVNPKRPEGETPKRVPPQKEPAGTPAEAQQAKSTQIADQALTDRPDLEIAGPHGTPEPAAAALEKAQDPTDWAGAVKSAVDCFARRGA